MGFFPRDWSRHWHTLISHGSQLPGHATCRVLIRVCIAGGVNLEGFFGRTLFMNY
jgi:hypothetical protein